MSQLNTRSTAVLQKVAQAGSGRHAQWHNPQTGRTWTVLRLWWESSTSDNNLGKPSPVRETVLLYKFLGNNYRNQSLNMLKSHLLNVIMFDKLPSNNLFCKRPNLMAYTCDLSTREAETEGSQLSVSLVYRVIQVSQSYGSVPELCVLPFCLYKDTWSLIADNRKVVTAFYLEGYLQTQYTRFIRGYVSIGLKSGSWGLWVPS